MLTSPQLDAVAPARAPRSTPRSLRVPDGASWREQGATPVAPPESSPPATAGTAPRPARRPLFRRFLVAAGVAGAVVAGCTAGWMAHDMGYDWRMAARIAGLAGVAGAAGSVMLPLLFRAIGWILLAAISAVLGAGAIYTLSTVAPAFFDEIMALLEPWIG